MTEAAEVIDEVIRTRRAVRGFRPEPVSPDVVRAAFEVAQRAPSNCNVQPWRVHVASGAARDRLRDRLVEAMKTGAPPTMELPIDDFPGEYRELQVACAVELYGKMGVARDDGEGRMRAHLRNYELFDAPHVAIVCMDRHFGMGVALDVGMYVQTLMLALWSRGVASCPQAALRAYAEIIRDELEIPSSELVLCGLAFGHEDVEVPANAVRQPREALERNVRFLET